MTFFEREREREKWSFEIFFLMKRTKAEESCVLNSHFFTSDAERERERARCGCDGVTAAMRLRLRAPSLFSSVNERKGRSFRPLITQSSRGLRVKCAVDITHSFLQHVRLLTYRFC